MISKKNGEYLMEKLTEIEARTLVTGISHLEAESFHDSIQPFRPPELNKMEMRP